MVAFERTAPTGKLEYCHDLALPDTPAAAAERKPKTCHTVAATRLTTGTIAAPPEARPPCPLFSGGASGWRRRKPTWAALLALHGCAPEAISLLEVVLRSLTNLRGDASLGGKPNVRQRKRLLAHVARERRERQRVAYARHFGSQTWVQQQPGAHDGPTTPSQFINYPLDILHAVKSQGLWEMTDSLGQARMARLLAILTCPLVIHADYTGKRTAETCFHL